MKGTTKQYPAKPFIKWVGGKGQLLTTIKQRLPQRLIEGSSFTYVEPFIGGGAMLFFMLQSFSNIKKAIINDISSALVNAYRVVKEQPSALIQQLSIFADQYRVLSDEERKAFYLGIRAAYNETKDNLGVETAARLIFLNKTCFNGLYRVNAKGSFNVPFGRYTSPNICNAETIMAASALLQKVEILEGDFADVIDYVSEGTFVYFDPPYRPLTRTAAFNTYAEGGFGDGEQRRLKAFFDVLNHDHGAALMLSNSDCRAVNPEDLFFDKLYADYYIERVHAGRMLNSKASARGKVSELLICNYPPPHKASI